MQTKTVTARAWFDTTYEPAAWAVRYYNEDDDGDQDDDILAEPEALTSDASADKVRGAVESHCRRRGWTLAGVEVV